MTSCRQPIGVSGVSTRIFVQRSRMTTTKVRISQRRRVGKVTRISLTSEIEERSLHYEPANYAGSPVGMTCPLWVARIHGPRKERVQDALTLPGWGAIYCAPTEKVEFVAHAGAAPDASPPDSISARAGEQRSQMVG